MAELSLRKILKVYGSKEGPVTAVDKVNLEIRDKEFLVLVGPSGCGKSTLLRMIAGLEEISGGELYIDGRLCNDVPPKDRDIAMVFQNYALYPHMTVEENMAFALKLRRLDKAEIRRRVGEAAEMLGLGGYLRRLPKQLSGGQRQRVALGRAIVRKPKVFLFDEPLSNLDAKMRVQMRVEIARLSKRLETTMIYVTHDQVEAMTMGDRIVCMRDGRVQQVGRPMEIYDRPANLFVAGFIGIPPMNVFHCRARQGGLEVQGADFLPLPELEALYRIPEGDTLALGVRPEHWKLQDHGGLLAEVELAEPLGAETYAYCLLRGRSPGPHPEQRLVVRLDPDRGVRRGDMLRLMPAPGRLRLFDPGERLVAPEFGHRPDPAVTATAHTAAPVE